MTTDHRYEQVRYLRDVEGLKWREVGARIGLSLQMAWQIYHDPTGVDARARKAKADGSCKDCGARTVSDGGRRVPERCRSCAAEYTKAQSRRWVVDAMREWAEMFGAPPSSVDWNPGLARKTYCAWKADRYEATGRPWPSATLVQNLFGSWNAGLTAAGFTPLDPSQHWLGHAGVALMNEDAA